MSETTSDNPFVAHGFLYLWQPELIWLHALSDLVIALAFFAIPVTLITLLRARTTPLPYTWVLNLFAIVLFVCGITHMAALISIWYPIYYLHGVLKATTAALAICTALILLPIMPLILKTLDDESTPPPDDHG